MRPQDDRRLRSVLHEEAEQHLPDRDAMLARINRRRAGSRRGLVASLLHPVGPRARRTMAVLRPAAAALAVAGVLVAGGTGISLANRVPDPEPAPPAAAPRPTVQPPTRSPAAPPRSTGGAAPSTTTPAPRTSGTAAPPSEKPRTPSRQPTTTGEASTPPPPPVTDGFVSATGTLDPYSIPEWSQTDLKLDTTEEITALDVTVRVARTAGVAHTGQWSSIPTELMTLAVTSSGTELVYRYTLNSGATLAKGSYVFAAQFNHDNTATRPLTGDTWEISATASSEVRLRGGYR